MNALLLTVVVLATLRTRVLLLTDDIGWGPRRLVFAGLERLQGEYTNGWFSKPKHPRRAWLANKLSEGWDCPWCLPFWIGAAWLGSGLAWGDYWAWQLLAGSLAVSYVVAHVTLRLDAEEE